MSSADFTATSILNFLAPLSGALCEPWKEKNSSMSKWKILVNIILHLAQQLLAIIQEWNCPTSVKILPYSMEVGEIWTEQLSWQPCVHDSWICVISVNFRIDEHVDVQISFKFWYFVCVTVVRINTELNWMCHIHEGERQD